MVTQGNSLNSFCDGGGEACLLDEMMYGISTDRINKSGRRLSVVLTSFTDGRRVVDTGHPDLRCESSLSHGNFSGGFAIAYRFCFHIEAQPQYRGAIKASMAVPMMFNPQPVSFREPGGQPVVHWCCDGAVVESIPTVATNKSAVDVILASPLARHGGGGGAQVDAKAPTIASIPWKIMEKNMEAQQLRSLGMIRKSNPRATVSVFSPSSHGRDGEQPFYEVSHANVMATVSAGMTQGMQQAIAMEGRPTAKGVHFVRL